MAVFDRYTFRIVTTRSGASVQYANPQRDAWHPLLVDVSVEACRESLLQGWIDVQFSDDEETHGSFRAFS